jgi:hypothetical protein
MVQVMHVFSLFYENNEKLSKLLTKSKCCMHTKVAYLYPNDLPNKGMCGEGDVVWL